MRAEEREFQRPSKHPLEFKIKCPPPTETGVHLLIYWGHTGKHILYLCKEEKPPLSEQQSPWKDGNGVDTGAIAGNGCSAVSCPILSLSAPFAFLGNLSVLILVLKISTLFKDELSKTLSENRFVPIFHFLLNETSYQTLFMEWGKANFPLVL